MFIFKTNRLKKPIIGINNFLFIILLILIYNERINYGLIDEGPADPAAAASVEETPLNDNKIFMIINKTIKSEIINDAYYDRIENIMINNNNPVNIENYNNSIYKSELEINYITIHFKNNINLTSCAYMFYNLSNIIYINLSDFNFQSYNVTNMEYMFSGCKSLLSINLGSFRNSDKGVNMNNMFSGCSSLLTLNISFFFLGSSHTTKVTNINSMFYECNSLVSLDIRNFKTSQVTDMRNTFANCSSLKILNINNFDTSSVTDMTNMFFGCSSLLSLNLNNFNTSSLSSYEDMFKNLNTNLNNLF